MDITGLQWNIQAARLRSPESNPQALESYVGDSPSYIGNYLAGKALDFITLQEVHANPRRDQAEEIAHHISESAQFVTDSYGQSFMNAGYDICQSIISKHPIVSHEYIPLQFEQYTPVDLDALDGEYVAKGTGLTVATLNVEGVLINIITLHMQPFSLFDIDPYSDEAKELRDSLESALKSISEPWILQGDFNVNGSSIGAFLGNISELSGYSEVLQTLPSIPAGKTIDHVAAVGVSIEANSVDADVLTDHYPVETTFKV
jgi:endonuclease/exonuclease/phosphatase family metal-dependent hydrolase